MLYAIAALILIIPPLTPSYQRMKTQSGIPMGWKTMPITYYISKGGSSQINDSSDIKAIKKSFSVWEKVDCAAIKFSYRGELTSPSIGYTKGKKNYNAVIWIKSINKWPYPYDVLATTQLFWDERTGEILDADILFNDFGFKWSTSPTPPSDRYDILNTAVHEIGHLLGLDHSDIPDSTMYFQSPAGEIKKRDLDEDDIKGICEIYPKKRKKISFKIISYHRERQQCNPPPTSTEKNGINNRDTQCNSGNPTSIIFPIIALLLALIIKTIQ